MNVIDCIKKIQNIINHILCKCSFTWCIYIATTYDKPVKSTPNSIKIDKDQIDDISDPLLLKLVRWYMLNNAWSNFPDIIVHDRFGEILVHVICDANRFVTYLPPDHYINYSMLKNNKIVIDYLNKY